MSLFTAVTLMAAAPHTIALIAGPITGHPKEAHEYEKSVLLLQHLLETSPDLIGQLRVRVYFQGWPAEPTALNDADTLVMITDGGDHREQDHPLYVGDRREQFRRHMQRGCGAVFLHWSVFHPSRFHDDITEWVGGYFDYETGSSPQKWYSAIQTWQAQARPVPGHPVTRGVNAWTGPEEFYYRMKFRGADPANAGTGATSRIDPRLTSLLTTRPPRETNDFTVAWAVERADGGRGFSTTGGHFYSNWWQPDWRRLILNAIAWSAKIEVPTGGIRSDPMDRFKALIVTGHNHPAHDPQTTTAALIGAIEQDPRAMVHVIEDPELLATSARTPKPAPGGFTGSLDDYQVVLWNYVNWERPGLSTAAKNQFLKYLGSGGGLVLVHFGASAFHPSIPKTTPADAWPEFSDRIARRVWEHRPPSPSGHDSFGPFQVEITGVSHPITAGLPSFETRDELYFHQAGTFPIIPLATAFSKVTRTNEPMAWAYNEGSARIFQTVLGHSAESIRLAAALIRRGTVWAAGRELLNFDPPVSQLENVLWRDGSPWKPKAAASKPSAAVPPGAATPGKPAALAAASPRTAGEPRMSGREPASQEESDWVDNRWQQTEIGPFLASVVGLPSGAIAKGLTLRVPGEPGGAVCYDTKSLTARAAWTGGFLQLDPSRFGLTGMPRPASPPFIEFPSGPDWQAAGGRFVGIRPLASRVVLELAIDGTRVLETPSLHRIAGGIQLVRSFEVGPHSQPLRLRIAAGSGWLASQPGPESENRFEWTQRGESFIASATFGRLELEDSTPGQGALTLPADTESRRFDLRLWRGPEDQRTPYIAADRANRTPPPATYFHGPNPARWLPPLTTMGHRGVDKEFLSVDTLTLPYDNPWKALLFGAGIDFTQDGTGYFCTIHGDVWQVRGIDASLRTLTWKRFATGLFQPLGLKVRDDQVFVLGRDRITRLVDENNDGEADFYENFHDAIETSAGGHDFVTSLERDDAGNFYYVDPKGVHRVTRDGRAQETLATGWRNPNGMGVSPDGSIVTVAPQQGTWTPSSVISEVKLGGYYGYPGPKATATRPLGYDPHLCWIPHAVDNSSGGQVWVPRDAWGPLGGQPLHLLWGRCSMLLVLRDISSGAAQGAVVPLPVKFLSGPNRGSFHLGDGSLYVAGSTGWQTSSLKDGSLQRVRYNGRRAGLPVGWKARPDGLDLTFSIPLDPKTAVDVGSFAVKRWNYRYTSTYGSKDWSVTREDTEGRDTVDVVQAELLPDGRTIRLRFADQRPAMQVEIKYNLDGTDERPVKGSLWLTLNAVPPSR